MIYLLLLATVMIYFYLLTSYVEYARLYTSTNLPIETAAQEKEEGLPFSNWIKKIKLSKRLPLLKVSGKSYKYYMSVSKGLAKFSGTLAIICVFYSILQLWLDFSASADKPASTIFQIEEAIHHIRSFIKPFKLSTGWDIFVTGVLIALAGSIPFVTKYALKKKYVKSTKIIGYLLQLLTIATSFTFFGSRFHDSEKGYIGALEMHKLSIIKENKLLIHDASEVIVDEVANSFVKEERIKALMDKATSLNYKLSDPAELSYDDSIYILISIEKLKPIVNEKLKLITENHTHDFDLEACVSKAEKDITAISPVKFENAIDDNLYTSIDKLTNGEIAGKNVSLEDLKEARLALEEVKSSLQRPVAIFPEADKFEEVLKKMIKLSLGKTLNKWITAFFENFAESNPFVGNIIDPIINDPVKDYITQKTIAILKTGIQKNNEGVSNQIGEINDDVGGLISEEFPKNQKIKNLEANLNEVEAALAAKKSAIIRDIYSNEEEAVLRYERIKSAGRFAAIRNEAYRLIKDGHVSVSEEARTLMQSSLEEWYEYQDEHKLEIGLGDENDPEHFFADYCYDNPHISATWGFILESDSETDQEILKKYAKEVKDEGGVIKPGHALLYYFEKNGYTKDEIWKHVIMPADNDITKICNSAH